MEAWGGNDDWDFEFEPEILRQQPVQVPTAENYDDNDDVDENNNNNNNNNRDDYKIVLYWVGPVPY